VNILFCHGKEGSPNGTKAQTIQAAFGNVITPTLTNSYDASDFLNDLEVVEEAAKKVDVLVGSSRGGALVTAARTSQRKILICPAWKEFKVVPYITKNDVIIHSKNDPIVPYKNSQQLADMFGCKLIEAGSDHRMSDPETLALIVNTIKGKQNV